MRMSSLSVFAAMIFCCQGLLGSNPFKTHQSFTRSFSELCVICGAKHQLGLANGFYGLTGRMPNVRSVETRGMSLISQASDYSDADRRRLNTLSLQYGGVAYHEALALSFEQRVLHYEKMSAYARLVGGFGSFGPAGAIGVIASMGEKGHHFDVGFSYTYLSGEEVSSLVPEVAYRYASVRGFTARLSLGYWTEVPTTIYSHFVPGISVGWGF